MNFSDKLDEYTKLEKEAEEALWKYRELEGKRRSMQLEMNRNNVEVVKKFKSYTLFRRGDGWEMKVMNDGGSHGDRTVYINGERMNSTRASARDLRENFAIWTEVPERLPLSYR